MDVTVSVINVREALSSTKSKPESDPKSTERNSKSFEYPKELEVTQVFEKNDTYEKETSDIKNPKESSGKDLGENSRRKQPKKKEVSNTDLQMFSPKEIPQEELKSKCESGDNSDTVSYFYGLHGVLILIVCTFFSAALTLIPRQNSILHPEYWYQNILLFNLLSLLAAFNVIITLSFFTDRKDLMSVMMCWKLFCARQMAFTVPYCVCYLIWTVHFGNYHPMPFIGLCSDLSNILQLCSVKFLIPKEIRDEDMFKQQFHVWIVYTILRLVLGYLRLVVSILIRIIPLEFQWITAIMIPTLRTIEAWILSKIVEKTPGTNIQRLKIYVNANVMIRWASFIAIRLTSLDDVTVYSILAVELILHIHGCLQTRTITKKMQDATAPEHDRNNAVATDMKNSIVTLVTSEFVEAFIPLGYGIAFTMAYYGPNAELYVNVGNDYFGGKPLENVNEFYIPMGLMFAFDAFGIVITAAYLHYSSNINVVQEFCQLMKIYWFAFMILLVDIGRSFASRDINFAADFTMEFLWTTDKGRIILFGNLTDT